MSFDIVSSQRNIKSLLQKTFLSASFVGGIVVINVAKANQNTILHMLQLNFWVQKLATMEIMQRQDNRYHMVHSFIFLTSVVGLILSTVDSIAFCHVDNCSNE